jgi:hypothetical protein
VVYHAREQYRWWGKYLNPRFRHVELMRPLQYGPRVEDVAWLHVQPTYEMIDADLCADPRPPWVRWPGCVVQRVTAMRTVGSMRSWFDVGPQTCVEVVKMFLGIRAFWVRTPYQLYRYVAARDGVINSR